MTFRVARALCAALLVAWATPASSQGQRNGVLTLPQALQRAAKANPRLAAADRTIAMTEGRRRQANTLPNPTVGFEVDNFASGADGVVQGAETTLALSQLIELGGKRDARVAAALGDYDAARWEREAARLELFSEVAVAFVGVLAVQRRLRLLERHAAALERLAPLMQRRVEAGASSPAEATRAQAATGFARLERERARTALTVARRELAVLLAHDQPDFPAVSGDFARLSQPAPFAGILKAIDENPQLMRWTAVRARRDADLLSARLKAVPDVTASIAWRHYAETSDNALRLGVSLPIPVLDRNRGGIREAQEAARKTEAERAINRLTLIAVVGKAHDSASGALHEIELLRRTVLPAARSTLSTIEAGYAQGRFTLLEILDAYRSVADAELMEHDALTSFHTAVATIEGLTGGPALAARGRGK